MDTISLSANDIQYCVQHGIITKSEATIIGSNTLIERYKDMSQSILKKVRYFDGIYDKVAMNHKAAIDKSNRMKNAKKAMHEHYINQNKNSDIGQ